MQKIFLEKKQIFFHEKEFIHMIGWILLKNLTKNVQKKMLFSPNLLGKIFQKMIFNMLIKFGMNLKCLIWRNITIFI